MDTLTIVCLLIIVIGMAFLSLASILQEKQKKYFSSPDRIQEGKFLGYVEEFIPWSSYYKDHKNGLLSFQRRAVGEPFYIPESRIIDFVRLKDKVFLFEGRIFIIHWDEVYMIDPMIYVLDFGDYQSFWGNVNKKAFSC